MTREEAEPGGTWEEVGCREESALLRTNCVHLFKVLSHWSGWSPGSFGYESAPGGASVWPR